MQRMPGKESRDRGAAPLGASQPPQYEKEEQSVGDVQQHAGEVMARRMQVKELAIGHVREPGQGMPIAGVKSLEGPEQSLSGESGPHVRVLGDVLLIVVIEKLV